MNSHIRLKLAAAVTLVLGAALLPSVTAPASATAVAAAPSGVRVAHTASGSASIAVTWKAVPGVDHYAIAVFDGRADTVHIASASTTSTVYATSGVCAHYPRERVRRDARREHRNQHAVPAR
jgi:hypothetical protein